MSLAKFHAFFFKRKTLPLIFREHVEQCNKCDESCHTASRFFRHLRKKKIPQICVYRYGNHKAGKRPMLVAVQELISELKMVWLTYIRTHSIWYPHKILLIINGTSEIFVKYSYPKRNSAPNVETHKMLNYKNSNF